MPFEMIERVVTDAVPHGLRDYAVDHGRAAALRGLRVHPRVCRRHGIKLNLTTNGTFPRGGADVWAERIVPVTSDVKISWNGSTKGTHEAIMLGSSWDKVVDNVRAFVAVRDQHATAGGNRCRVTFQLTFLESNT